MSYIDDWNLDDEHSTICHRIHHDDVMKLKEMLVGHEEKLTVVTKSKQQTLLHLSVSNCSIRILQYLCIAYKTNPSFLQACNIWGESALHMAAASGDKRMVLLLIQAGVSQTLTDKWNRTAVDIALQMEYLHLIGDDLLARSHATSKATEAREESLSAASRQFSAIIAKKLATVLKNRPSSQPVATKIRGIFQDTYEVLPSPAPLAATPMMKPKIALSKVMEFPGNVDHLRTLLAASEHDYELNGKDMFGLTALHKSAAWNSLELLEFLLTQPELDVNAQGSMGTALHSAVQMGAEATVRRLLQHSALDRSLADKEGRSAQELAQQVGYTQITALFQQG
jgi:ankyrin repeat protein